jgi:hypothetical protein
MKVLSNWRSIRLWETQLERDLHRRYSLRAHGLGIGTLMLLLMWGLSAAQMALGVDSLALRYLVTLGTGYGAYLLVLRWWAWRLVEPRTDDQSGADLNVDGLDSADLPTPEWGAGGAPHSFSTGGGGDFGGGGASGDFGGDHALNAVVEVGGRGLGHMARGALHAAASAEEGAVVVMPVVAVFLLVVALVCGAGALVLMYFGFDALLAVAIEVAFSYTAARAAVRISREGWLGAAVRLTWKPLLGAIVCAVLLGWVVDHFMPHAHSLAAAVRMLLNQ